MSLDKICYNCVYGERNNERNKEYWFTGKVVNEIYCKRDREYVDKTHTGCSNFVPVNENKSSGCFITTVVVDVLGYPDDCSILNTLRYFRDDILQSDYKYHDLLKTYDVIGPKIANSLIDNPNRERISLVVSEYYLIPICRLINNEDYRSAVNAYVGMVRFLKNQLNIMENTESYEYDKDVSVKEMGHGTALVRAAKEE